MIIKQGGQTSKGEWKRAMKKMGEKSKLCGDLGIKWGHQIKEDEGINTFKCFYEVK